jgi:hypothetical protein
MMNIMIRDRLPGVYFQAEPPPLEETLPRMDIAAFVGLAASGPLDTPVPVEDVTRFRDIFGDDLPLAWDTTTRQMQYAHLAPAVEAFFRNGGRRCWVVRVAEGARTNRFSLPGLVRIEGPFMQTNPSNWWPALARARCEGSWSDTLRVSTVQSSQALGEVGFQHDPSDPEAYHMDISAISGSVSPGDLLQLDFDDALSLFLAIDSVEPAPITELTTGAPFIQGVRRIQPFQRAKGKQGYWFLRRPESSLPLVATRVVLLTPDGELPLPLRYVQLPDEQSPLYKIDLDLLLKNAPIPGDLLRIDFTDGQSLLLPVMTVEVAPETSPPGMAVQVQGKEGFWPIEEASGLAWVEAGSPPEERKPFAGRLAFEIWVWHGQETLARLSNLGFSDKHPRFWGKLPVDKDLFRLPDRGSIRTAPGPLEVESSDPRFPLAGPEQEELAAFYLPLGMPIVPDQTMAQGPLDGIEPGTELQRDGLENFSADLFLDKDLASVGSEALLAEANYRYYVQDKSLRGLHSLLPLDEVTLVAVPDAVQQGWKLEARSLTPLLAPELNPVPRPDDQSVYTLSWSIVEGATGYTLQEGMDPTFLQPVTLYEGTENTVTFSTPKSCPKPYYYRVRAARNGEISPWSNTERTVVPWPEFEDCEVRDLGAPRLEPISLASPPGDDYSLHWLPVVGATRYTLQDATDPAFNTATTIYTGGDTTFRVGCRRDGVYYYRAQAQRNEESGPWSNTQIFVSSPRQVWTVNRPENYSNIDLLAVQRALLRFCSARGDLLALLSLPGFYREDETLAHVTALVPDSEGGAMEASTPGQVQVMPLTFGEEQVFSFGTLYHPWVALRIESGRNATAIRFIPPDGAVCGTMAAIALTRGAWMAPANEPLRGVISLDPPIGRQGWERLFKAQVNLIRQDPRGFLVLSADTLSPETDLQPINVRRLLTLLRRLALREGMAYVFQPNNENFHRLVRHKFERLLASLYAKGAFAGNIPTTAYQVVADKSINTPVSLEQGRFIIELRVAPSQPMAFITVRLVQRGQEGLVIQEV